MQTYAIRRAILAALKKYASVPVRAVDLIEYAAEPAIQAAEAEAVKTQWTELLAFGYIVQIEGFNGEYCRITEKGLKQLSLEFKRDPFIWGPAAAN